MRRRPDRPQLMRKPLGGLRRSGLDWTGVYPVALTNGPRTGRYRIGERVTLRGVPAISRTDVADFILTQVEDRTFLRRAVLISY